MDNQVLVVVITLTKRVNIAVQPACTGPAKLTVGSKRTVTVAQSTDKVTNVKMVVAITAVIRVNGRRSMPMLTMKAKVVKVF